MELDEASDKAGVDRLNAFTDGVFAIAITLLVLDLRVPLGSRDLGAALLNAWPHYLSYTLSFVTIGIIWAQHHSLFRLIRHSDHVFMLINVLFLLWLAALPFPTSVLADHLGKDGERTAMLFYAGMWVIGTLPFNLLWRYASWNGRLLHPSVDPHLVAAINRGYLVGPLCYTIVFIVAFFSVHLSLVLIILIGVYYAVAPIPAIARTRIMRPLTGLPPPPQSAPTQEDRGLIR